MAPYVGAPEIKARRLVLTVEYHGQIGNPGLNRMTELGRPDPRLKRCQTKCQRHAYVRLGDCEPVSRR